MLSPSLATFRLFFHVLAATVWVGGQLTLAGLVPGLRAAHPEAPGFAARRFNLIAWPAFVILWLTGIWNILAVGSMDGKWGITLSAKILIVVASGVSAAAHARSQSKAALAIFGALAGLTSLMALFFGILLGTGS